MDAVFSDDEAARLRLQRSESALTQACIQQRAGTDGVVHLCWFTQASPASLITGVFECLAAGRGVSISQRPSSGHMVRLKDELQLRCRFPHLAHRADC